MIATPSGSDGRAISIIEQETKDTAPVGCSGDTNYRYVDRYSACRVSESERNCAQAKTILVMLKQDFTTEDISEKGRLAL